MADKMPTVGLEKPQLEEDVCRSLQKVKLQLIVQCCIRTLNEVTVVHVGLTNDVLTLSIV